MFLKSRNSRSVVKNEFIVVWDVHWKMLRQCNTMNL